MFDPYHKWLGIPTGKRPPTHYQLLAISEGEEDREVIEAATVRQSAYVRNFQKGPNAEEATKLLAEISEARATLTDPARRKEYDGRLAAQRPQPKPVAAAPRAAVAVPAQAVAARLAPPKPPSPKGLKGRKSSSAISVAAVVGIIGVVAIATGIGVYFATRPKNDDLVAAVEKKPDQKNVSTEKENSKPAQESEKPANVGAAAKVERPPQKHNEPKFGPPPGFGQPPPGFGQPPPGFGQPPKGFGPPPGLFKGPQGGMGQPNVGQPGGNVPDPNPNGNQGKKKDDGTVPPKLAAEGIDGLIEMLNGRSFWEVDKAAKQLITTKIDAKRRDDVAKALNSIIETENHFSDAVYDAVAVWWNDETVRVIADKLNSRPFVSNGAIKAAGKMKNPKLALPLCVLLENFFSWEEATRALQQMGPACESNVLLLLNKHRDPKMKIQACKILADAGTEKSLPSLRRAAGEKNTSLAARAAIQQITERTKEKADDGDEEPKGKSSSKK
jgi:hypothetical protein